MGDSFIIAPTCGIIQLIDAQKNDFIIHKSDCTTASQSASRGCVKFEGGTEKSNETAFKQRSILHFQQDIFKQFQKSRKKSQTKRGFYAVFTRYFVGARHTLKEDVTDRSGITILLIAEVYYGKYETCKNYESHGRKPCGTDDYL
ncbi:hypothetical protein SDC9_143236 [bioreactor metagenome]|uniref:Uncharacterized protein n=1 Tax=bioreactor metagenome TaxID=1076179 RepID=A0A645E3G6_9ZZZZ